MSALDGQQRRSMTFQVARVTKALVSVSQMVKNGNKLVLDQDSSGKDMTYIFKTNDPMRKYRCDRKRRVRLGSDGGTSVYQQRSKYSSAFSPAGIASVTPVSPIENQLRKVVPELCLNDVLENVAEVEMSSAGSVAEAGVEKQRVAHVEVDSNIQDENQGREGTSCGKECASIRSPELPACWEAWVEVVVELSLLVRRLVHCVRGAGRSDAHRRRARQDEEERVTTRS